MTKAINLTKIKASGLAIVGLLVLVSFLLFSMNILRQAKLEPKQKIVTSIAKLQIIGKLTHIDSLTIRNKLNPLLSNDLLNLDLSNIQNIIQDIDWVRNVSVVRVFPGILRINIIEQEAVAIWNKKSYLNPWGEIFNVTKFINQPKLIKLHGRPEHAPAILKLYVNIKDSIGEQQLTTIFQSHTGIYRLHLANGLEVILGRKQLSGRITRLNKILSLLVEFPNTISRIDLRYRRGLAVKLTKRGQNV